MEFRQTAVTLDVIAVKGKVLELEMLWLDDIYCCFDILLYILYIMVAFRIFL